MSENENECEGQPGLQQADREDQSQEATNTLLIKRSNVPIVCCTFLAAITTGGTTYAFGLYGNALKKGLHLTQSQLDTISTANFCAGLLSWVPGMFVDRFGTRLGISLGGVTGASSNLVYWAVATGRIKLASTAFLVAILSLLGVLTFLSCALITGAVFKTISITCGPGAKGAAVGVAKGYVGLGAGCFACIFESIRQPSSSDLNFLPMTAFFFIVCAAVPSFVVLPAKAQEKDVVDVLTPLHFRTLYASLVILAILIVGSSLSQLLKGEVASPSITHHGMAGTIIFVWIVPILMQIFLPQKPVHLYASVDDDEQDLLLSSEESNGQDVELSSTIPDREEETQPTNLILREDAESTSVEGGTSSEEIIIDNRRDKNLFEMLQTAPAWLMLWTTTILVGAGTVETNNLGQMVESLKFSPLVTSASLAIFSVAQAAGRVCTGSMSEAALGLKTKRCGIDNGIPRPFFLVLASLTSILAHITLAVSTGEVAFILGIALSGLAFGSVWPLMVLITGEIFGMSHVAANYMFYDGFTSAGGTFLLSKVVAQEVYESHIDSHYSENTDGVTCYGQKCFQLTHIIIALLSASCLLTGAMMQYFTRENYQKSVIHNR